MPRTQLSINIQQPKLNTWLFFIYISYFGDFVELFKLNKLLRTDFTLLWFTTLVSIDIQLKQNLKKNETIVTKFIFQFYQI